MIPAGECDRCGMEHRRCHAHVHRPEEGGIRPCGAYPIRGGTVCPVHGGMAPQVQAKAKETLALRDEERRALESFTPRRPHEILLEALHKADARAQQAEAEGRPEAEQLRTQAARLAQTAIDKDLEAAGAALTEADAAELAALLNRVLARLRLSEEQRALVADVVREELRQVGVRPAPLLRYGAEALAGAVDARLSEAQSRIVAEAWRRAVAGLGLSESECDEVTRVFLRALRSVSAELDEAEAVD